MVFLFKCSTNDGFMFKILGEILHNTLKVITLTINEKGIFSKVMDSHKKLLVDISMDAINFNYYNCKNPMFFGINVSHLYRIISSIKKKDSISLIIEEDNPTELQIVVIPKEKDHTEISCISIQNIQSLDIDVPENYNYPVHVSSAKFQKMCKDMLNIGKEIVVYGSDTSISFRCETPGIYKKKVSFGEENSEEIPMYTFEVEQLVRISKISSLGNVLYVYLQENLPLKLQSNIGNIGKISIYIKNFKL